MPLPTPNAGESQDEFVGRRMADDVMVSEYDDEDQRLAVCHAQWKKRGLTMDVEKRYLQEVELQDSEEGKRPRIVGYAARFNSKSLDLGGFREVVLPGAFARTLAAGRDIKATYNHDPRLVLGSTKAGTLTVVEDGQGLRVEIDPPESRADVVESIRRGDVDAMSFVFKVQPGDDEMTWEDGQTLRTLKQVELLDVGPATYPAYPQTSVSVRALETAKAMTAAAEVPVETPNLDACREKIKDEV